MWVKTVMLAAKKGMKGTAQGIRSSGYPAGAEVAGMNKGMAVPYGEVVSENRR